MTDIKNMFIGLGSLFGITIICMILDLFLPILIDTVVEITNFTALENIIWYVIMIFYLVAIIGIPTLYAYKGITEESHLNGIDRILYNILILVFMISLLAVSYFMIPNFAEMIDNQYTKSFFYISLFIQLITNIIIFPMQTFSNPQ